MTTFAIKRKLDGVNKNPLKDPIICSFNAEPAAKKRMEDVLSDDEKSKYYIDPISV